MLYTGTPTDWLNIPVPAAGDVSSAAEESLRSNIPDWVLEILTKALTDENGDGTLGDGFQVSDDGGLDIEVSAGQGFIGGLVIEAAAPTGKADLTDDQVNYVFLKKTATTFEDQSFTVEISLSDSMADAILIAAVTCASGDITDVTNTPTGRAPYIRDNPNPQIINDIPGLKVVAPSGGNYTSPKTAIEAASAGDVIYICAGTYDEAATIIIPNNNLTIIGANRGACILNFTAADANDCIDLNGKDGLRLADFQVQAVAGKTGNGISGTGCDRPKIHRVRIVADGLTTAINLVTCDRAEVTRCEFESGYVGGKHSFYADGCDRLIFESNDIHLTGVEPTRGVSIFDSDACQVITNTVRVDDPAANIFIMYARANLDDVNSFSRWAGNIIVSTGGDGYGIVLGAAGDPRYLDDTQVLGNTIFNCLEGIRVGAVGVRQTRVHDNNVRTCTTGISDVGTDTDDKDNT